MNYFPGWQQQNPYWGPPQPPQTPIVFVPSPNSPTPQAMMPVPQNKRELKRTLKDLKDINDYIGSNKKEEKKDDKKSTFTTLEWFVIICFGGALLSVIHLVMLLQLVKELRP